MGSHLTDALVALGANVHAFVRATSSGALNNIAHLRGQLKVHFADLTDKHSIDLLVRQELLDAPDRPFVFHLGAQAHVGESWHRPYETVMTNTSGRSTCSSRSSTTASSWRSSTPPAPPRSTGTSASPSPHHHDFDDEGGLILHERSPINPKSVYATAKVAADFLTLNYHDAYGLPGHRHADVQQLRPAQNPRYVTGTIITQALEREEVELGALEPLRDFCFCTDGVRGHLAVTAHGMPGQHYVYGQGANISMARLGRADLQRRRRARLLARGVTRDRADRSAAPARLSDVDALRVGYEKLTTARRAGSRRSPGRTASRTPSAGTRRTATSGSAASTGSAAPTDGQAPRRVAQPAWLRPQSSSLGSTPARRRSSRSASLARAPSSGRRDARSRSSSAGARQR